MPRTKRIYDELDACDRGIAAYRRRNKRREELPPGYKRPQTERQRAYHLAVSDVARANHVSAAVAANMIRTGKAHAMVPAHAQFHAPQYGFF